MGVETSYVSYCLGVNPSFELEEDDVGDRHIDGMSRDVCLVNLKTTGD